MDPIAYLLDLERIGIKFGLEHIRALDEALGRPSHAYPSVIVAGTNGKGSVAAIVDRALTAAGHRSGRYTSPHLVRIEERFAIDGRPVSSDALRDTAACVCEVVARLRAADTLTVEPTFFEVTTAIGFELFRRAGVTIAVLEVGMGGRLDATNVATPLAAAITTIDFDHEQFLGTTLGEIAFEKAGVIKPDMIVVLGETKPEAVEIVRRACDERHAALILAREGVTVAGSFRDGRLVLDLETPVARYRSVPLALRGRHQAVNALVAVRLLEALRERGVSVPHEAVIEGLRSARWPGRLDLVRVGNRAVLFDAAHNPEGARALAAYLGEMHPDGVPIVFSVMRDKNAEAMLAALAPHASRFVFTEAPTPRVAPLTQLVHAARRAGCTVPVDLEPQPRAALDRAWTSSDLAVVAGSIFLVGALLPHVAPDGPV